VNYEWKRNLVYWGFNCEEWRVELKLGLNCSYALFSKLCFCDLEKPLFLKSLASLQPWKHLKIHADCVFVVGLKMTSNFDLLITRFTICFWFWIYGLECKSCLVRNCENDFSITNFKSWLLHHITLLEDKQDARKEWAS